MNNESGLSPCGRAVLVAPYEPERKQGLIIVPDTAQSGMQMVEQRAIVIEIGPNAWHTEPGPRAAVGDKVLVSRYAGYMAKGTKDGKQYRFVNDNDIFAKITHEELSDE
jgi:co-chaperonin GroES (HSP10)